MRVVMDTNVIVSAFLSSSGAPAQALAYLQEGRVDLLVSQPILDEYLRALGYPQVQARHGLDNAALEQVVNDLRAVAILVEPNESLELVEQDPADNKFFECAVAGEATYIVSGDAHVRAVGDYRGIRVLSPSLFAELMRSDQA